MGFIHILVTLVEDWTGVICIYYYAFTVGLHGYGMAALGQCSHVCSAICIAWL